MVEQVSPRGIELALRPRTSPAWRLLKHFFRDPKAIVSAVILAGFLILALGSSWIAPYGENEQNPLESREAPSGHHLMGTDRIGRDVFSRVVYGTRTSISVGLIAVAVAC